MAAISGINTGSQSLPGMTTAKESAMGKEDFLKLLVAQMQNQDPMNPSDPTEFTSQLAQFSQLEQLTNVNKSLEGLTTMSSEMERMSALGLIGKDVVAQTESFQANGQEMKLGYRLEAPAESVNLYVLNSSGATVAELTAQETASGQHFVDWNGKDNNGMPVEEGQYRLAIKAVDKDKKIVKAETLLKGRVEGVDMSGSDIKLDTSAGSFAMSKVAKAGVSL